MAAEDEGKTEEPTQKRIQDARKDGNVAKSQDLGASTVLLAGIIMLYFLAPWMRDCIGSAIYRFIVFEMPENLPGGPKESIGTLIMALQYVFYCVAPFIIVLFFVAVFAAVYQVGILFSTKPLVPDFAKLNPVKGLTNLFSKKKMVMMLMNIGKVALIMIVVWPVVTQNYGGSNILTQLGVRSATIMVSHEVWGLALRIALVMFIWSIVDFFWQKHQWKDQLKMDKQEVKDEHRNMEGDPKVKQKRMQKMFEMAQKRMMQEIPEAEVVVRNPTHFAVALKFKEDMHSPQVVAKGKDKMALKIIDLAREAGVPLWEDPPLARELYKRCELGDSIPPELFQAVADVLAHVMDKEKRAQFANKAGAA